MCGKSGGGSGAEARKFFRVWFWADTATTESMSDNADQPQARVTVQPDAEGCKVILAGVWRITAAPPRWSECAGGEKSTHVTVVMDAVERWDSSLLLFLFEVQQWCRTHGANLARAVGRFA